MYKSVIATRLGLDIIKRQQHEVYVEALCISKYTSARHYSTAPLQLKFKLLHVQYTPLNSSLVQFQLVFTVLF